MNEDKKNSENVENSQNNDVITQALDEEEKEFTKTLTEELQPVAPVKEKVEDKVETPKVKETEDSVDAADFVTKEEFYGKENKTLLHN